VSIKNDETGRGLFPGAPGGALEIEGRVFYNTAFYILEKNNDKKLGLGHIFHMNHEEKGDVARNVKTIIDLSGYDNENKGAYKAAIVDKRN